MPIDHVKLPVSDKTTGRPASGQRRYYYAAFGLDPDGHNIEAVLHGDVSRRG